MNPKSDRSPEDRLIEELLHEQHHGADEAFLRKIEAAVDGASPASNKSSASRSWGRYGIAASIALAAGGIAWWQNDQRKHERVAILESSQPSPEARQRMAAEEEMRRLSTSVQEEAAKVEDRRKEISSAVRTKGIIYKETQSSGDASKPGNAPNDLVDAKKGFETEHKQLEELQHEQTELASNSGVEIPKANETPDASQQTEIVEGGLEGVRGMPKMRDTNAAQASAQQAADANVLSGSDPIVIPGIRPRIVPPSGQDSSLAERSKREFERGSGSGQGAATAPGTVMRDVSLQRENRSGGFAIQEAPLPLESPTAATSDRYGKFIDQPWKTPNNDPLSTFSIDVDTASYGNVRRMIHEGREIPRDAVRIEECINAFSYSYQAPKGDAPFAVGASLAVCPWNPEHQLVRVAIKGREVDAAKRPASNLVFLIDVSGSMQSPDKLPLLKQSMTTLVEQLDERDRVAIVVYAGSEGVALPSTRLDAEGRSKVLQTLAKLQAGGSTNGGAGIKRAYQIAMDGKLDGGVNRVILATDGDFNVGVTGNAELVSLVKERAKSGVYLTVLGYGTGNLNDAMMDAITRDGNGNYFYIDSEREGRKVFLRNLSGTLVAIAKDVKIQMEFNPAKVGGYRLIGYANRVLKNEDFHNDKVDAGDIGAGHTVTAFYEISPKPVAGGTDGLKYRPSTRPVESSDEWLTVKLRHKAPDGDESRMIEFALTGVPKPIAETDRDFQFASAVAFFGMKLRGMYEVSAVDWSAVKELAKPGLAEDRDEDRAEFVRLLDRLSGARHGEVPQPAEVIRER